VSGLVIVGGSYAGLNIALAARQHGYSERIRILTNEPVLPYHRPPLSKGYLLGATDPQTLPLRGEAFYAQNGIDVLLQTQVHSIGPARLQTNRGNVPFEKLAIATGARARLVDLPGIELDGVVTLRSLADTEAIRQRLADVSHAVIIGAGFIGLELAATLRKLQKEVTVLEGQQRVLARATTPSVSAFISGEHQRHGIDLRCNTSVVELTGDRQRVKSVRLADGTLCPADLVVLAVGALPNGELGAPLGLLTRGAIEVDSIGRTRLEHCYAAGDCTIHPNAFSGTLLRLESVQNATDQGKSAGAALAGVHLPYDSVPWFWSDQHDLKLQMAGFSQGADREVLRGSVEDHRFSLFYLRDGRLVGVDSVNAPADHMLGRRLLSQRIAVLPEALGDLSFDLRALLKAA
jgi:3-phenylpropionate/trans-cinnamate dioxygenase ferredoxin reductase subunit